jgi:hypothetical protein
MSEHQRVRVRGRYQLAGNKPSLRHQLSSKRCIEERKNLGVERRVDRPIDSIRSNLD